MSCILSCTSRKVRLVLIFQLLSVSAIFEWDIEMKNKEEVSGRQAQRTRRT